MRHVQVKRQRGRWTWRWSDPWRWPCRIGLHFLHHDLAMDGYVCACRRIHLWAEQIVP